MTTSTHDLAHKRTAAIPRSRGAVSGLLLAALGAWGALVPFLGPYDDFGFTPDTTWHMTTVRFFLEVLPGAAAFLAGLVVLTAKNRYSAMVGGWLAVAAGAWFVVGPLVWPTFRDDFPMALGSSTRVFVEQATLFFGLGALVVFLGAFLLGRVSVVSVRDIAAAEKRASKKDAQQDAVVQQETVPVVSQADQPVATQEAVPVATQDVEPTVIDLPRDATTTVHTDGGATSQRTT